MLLNGVFVTITTTSLWSVRTLTSSCFRVVHVCVPQDLFLRKCRNLYDMANNTLWFNIFCVKCNVVKKMNMKCNIFHASSDIYVCTA